MTFPIEIQKLMFAGKSLESVNRACGHATFMMTENCGNTETHQYYNAVSTVDKFVTWAEANGHVLPATLVAEVRALYETLPNGE